MTEGTGPGEAAVAEDPLKGAVPDMLAARVEFPFVTEIGIPFSAGKVREALGGDYPVMRLEHRLIKTEGGKEEDPPANELHDLVWRLSENGLRRGWSVALSGGRVELEAGSCYERDAFFERLAKVVDRMREAFGPGCCSGLGLRLFNEAGPGAPGEAVSEEGIGSGLRGRAFPFLEGANGGSSRTETAWRTESGTVVRSRWGQLSAEGFEAGISNGKDAEPGWALEVDLHKADVVPFEAGPVAEAAEALAESLAEVLSGMGADSLGMRRKANPLHAKVPRFVYEDPESPDSLYVSDSLSPAEAVSELPWLAALKWEEVADLLGVSRRAVYNWKYGKRMSRKNRALVYKLLKALRHLFRGVGSFTRPLLFEVEQGSGKTRFDLLKERRFDEAVAGVENLGVRRIDLKNRHSEPLNAPGMRNRPIVDQIGMYDMPDDYPTGGHVAKVYKTGDKHLPKRIGDDAA